MKNRFLNLSKIIAKYSFVIFIFIFSFANIFVTTRRYNNVNASLDINYLFGINFINIVILLIISLIAVYLYKNNFFNVSSKKYMYLFLIFCLFVGIVWIFINPWELVELDDAYNCYHTAISLLSGDYGVIGYKSYINTYPHNLTLVTYFMIFIKLFGEYWALLAIRITNLILVIVGYYFLYKITDLMFENEKTNQMLIILMYLSTQYVFYSFMVYSNVISYTFGIISLYFFLKYYKADKLKNLFISLLFIVTSAALKNNSLIILIAELIFLIIKMIKKINYKAILILIINLLILALMTTGTVKFWEKRSGNDYSNKLPLICWLAYGINYYEGAPGGYTNELERYYIENDCVTEFVSIKASQFIRGSLNDFKEKPVIAARFYCQKFLFSFANPEYDAFASYRRLDTGSFATDVISGNINELIFNTWDVGSTFVSIGLILYVLLNFKNINLDYLLLGVCVIGGFIFHSFWETKSIYLYQYFLLLLPYASKGIEGILEKRSKK